MIDVFLTITLPVFIVALIAAAFQRRARLPGQTLGQVTLYLFTPALVFHSLLTTNADAALFGRVTAAYLLTTTLVGALGYGAAALLRQPRDLQSAFLLAVLFPNVGNTGMPVSLLAFGQGGLTVAVIIVVVQSFISASFGTVVAARGSMVGREAFLQMFRLPSLYAVIAAVGVKAVGWELPPPLSEPARLLAQAAIPTMLCVLGFQLAAGPRIEQPGSLGAALLIRLVLAAPLGYLAARACGLEGVPLQTMTVMAAMPTAVFTIILASEFKARPSFVTSMVVSSALVGLVTLSAIITIVRQIVD